MKRYCIIFDLDGVIIDSKQVIQKAFLSAYEQVVVNRISPPPFDIFISKIGMRLDDILHDMDLPRKMAPIIRQITIDLNSQVALFPGIKEVIQLIFAHKHYIGIATGKDRFRVDKILEKQGISDLFDKVICSDEVKSGKPHPDSIEKHLANSSISKNDTYFIGDSIIDIQCARNAGVNSIAVSYGFGSCTDLQNANPDYLVENISGLEGLLKKIGIL
ncbi:MAG: HAD-IA family hydrolase [Legionellales bacterium]|nr:HAD-IA family hydrolase [Legionellales bacterium]